MNTIRIRKVVSIVGILIPIIFVTSFAVFIASNEAVFSFIEFGSFFAYNLEGVPNQFVISYFTYFLVGALIVVFALGLFLLLPKSVTNKLGAIFFILCGVLWSSYAFFPQKENEDNTLYLLSSAISIIILGSLAQMLICNDIHKLIVSSIAKYVLLIGGVLFIFEFAICIFVPDFFIGIPVLSVLAIIFNIGFIGFHLSKDYDFIDRE
jgi:hypothetical protein